MMSLIGFLFSVQTKDITVLQLYAFFADQSCHSLSHSLLLFPSRFCASFCTWFFCFHISPTTPISHTRCSSTLHPNQYTSPRPHLPPSHTSSLATSTVFVFCSTSIAQLHLIAHNQHYNPTSIQKKTFTLVPFSIHLPFTRQTLPPKHAGQRRHSSPHIKMSEAKSRTKMVGRAGFLFVLGRVEVGVGKVVVVWCRNGNSSSSSSYCACACASSWGRGLSWFGGW
jgi:hypothetical protein